MTCQRDIVTESGVKCSRQGCNSLDYIVVVLSGMLVVLLTSLSDYVKLSDCEAFLVYEVVLFIVFYLQIGARISNIFLHLTTEVMSTSLLTLIYIKVIFHHIW